jgi:hypothetical protein
MLLRATPILDPKTMYPMRLRPHPVMSGAEQCAQGWSKDMEQVLRLVIVFFAALSTGGLIVNWIGLGRAMSRVSASTYVEFHQATNHTFDPYVPIVIVSALFGGVVLAIFSQAIHSLSGELAIAGSACYVVVLAIGLPTSVRINKQIAHWLVQSPPANWAPVRAKWVRFHIFRTLFSLPGLACYVLACLVSR